MGNTKRPYFTITSYCFINTDGSLNSNVIHGSIVLFRTSLMLLLIILVIRPDKVQILYESRFIHVSVIIGTILYLSKDEKTGIKDYVRV